MFTLFYFDIYMHREMRIHFANVLNPVVAWK